MLKKTFFVFVFLVSTFSNSYATELENLKAINQVYHQFIQSFELLDANLFAQIHSEKLIRIPGGKQIIDYKTYVENQRSSFEKAQKENSTRSIYLRFIERVNNDSVSSERGIYKFIKNENLPGEKISYGKFHVLMIKENGMWKILMDYDSSEGKIINESDYKQASDMNDFEKFLQH